VAFILESYSSGAMLDDILSAHPGLTAEGMMEPIPEQGLAEHLDYHGARLLLPKLIETVTTLKKLWADGIYSKGGLVDWVHETFGIVLEIVKRPPDQVGFQVLPRRWVVERTLAWLGRYRRSRRMVLRPWPKDKGFPESGLPS